MKATIISSIADLKDVTTKAVIFPFRPSMDDLLKTVAKGIKVIQINAASAKSLSKSAYLFMEQSKVKCLTGSIQGIRRDKHGDIVEIDVPKT
jgi:hypothetical protein